MDGHHVGDFGVLSCWQSVLRYKISIVIRMKFKIYKLRMK